MTDPSNNLYLAIKVAMMPRDTNPHGTIFGGVILSYIDQAGAIGARAEILGLGHPEPLLVTVALDQVEFHHPVFVGDVVSFQTSVVRIGRTSVSMYVVVETPRDGKTIRLTEATVTYVAVDPLGQPAKTAQRRPVPIRGKGKHH